MKKRTRRRKHGHLSLERPVEQQHNQQMLDQLNRTYADTPLTDEKTRLLEALRRKQRHLVDAEG